MASTGKFIGGIKFGVSMDTKKLNRDVKKARGTIDKFVGGVKKAIFSVKGLGAALTAGAFVKFTTDAARAIDSLAKVSDKLGIATEELAGLRLAAEETGVASNTLDMALQRMVRRVAEAAIGLGEARDALKTLGINAKTLARLSPDRQFRQIAEAMSKVSDNGERIRLAFKLFDSEGVALVNTLKLGKAGLDEAAQAARDMGLAIDRESARAVEKSIDAFNRFKTSIGGIFRDIAVEISPIITGLAEDLRTLVQETRKLPRRVKGSALGQVVRGIGLTQPTLSGFKDTGPRSTTPGPNNAQFRTPADLAAFNRANPNFAAFKGLSGALKAIAKQGQNAAKGLGQGAGGVANLPLFKFLPAFLANLADQVPEAKKPKRTSLGTQGSLSFTQAGSAESFRQRAAIRNANELKKLDQKRNTTLTQIKDQLTKNPVVLLQANL